jgi:NAD(P)-dependent dehydrogenase (short-subunit alcohol dehydrogenase family)
MSKPAISKNSVVLVSGGGRGITAECVKELAGGFPCRYILLGRSPLNEGNSDPALTHLSDGELKSHLMKEMAAQGKKPSPQVIEKQFRQIRAQQEINTTLTAIKESGGSAEYLPVNISNPEMLRTNLKPVIDRLGPVTGIIHGAGTLADKRIEKKTAEDFEAVVSPKVDGLRNLLDVVPPANLDFLVLFSSIVGVFGNIGQADYAIANEVLNKTAYKVKQENPDCRVLSINWGPWDSGMVTPELARAFAERNMPVIPTHAGAQTLVKLLSVSYPDSIEPVQVVVGSIPTRPPVTVSPELNTYYIKRKLVLDKNPFLFDHRIGDNPVLPATCAASWVASACEQLYPGYFFSKIEDFKVLKGIVFEDAALREYTLELKETKKDPSGTIRFDARVTSQSDKNRPIFHYSLNVELERQQPVPPVHTAVLQPVSGDQQPVSGDSLYADGTLFHGPSFQGVRRVLHISEGRILLECNLPSIPPEKQGQFPTQTTNPFIYDAIVQSLLIWSQEYYESPCLPSQLDRLEHYKAIPFDRDCLVDMRIVAHSSTYVTADIWVTDSRGEVYVIFRNLKGTISPLLRRLIGKKSTGSI